jgi:hypothetical protein
MCFPGTAEVERTRYTHCVALVSSVIEAAQTWFVLIAEMCFLGTTEAESTPAPNFVALVPFLDEGSPTFKLKRHYMSLDVVVKFMQQNTPIKITK